MYDGDASIWIALLIILFVVFLITLPFLFILIISKWRLLNKAGEAGWKAIIPVYGDMVLCEVVGVWEYYPLALLGVSLAGYFLDDSSIGSVLSLLYYAGNIYYLVILNVSVAKSFGKDTGFGIGLLLLGIIFYPILAFGNNQYIGKNPMSDPIMDSILNNKNSSTSQGGSTPTVDTTSDTSQQHHGHYCPECGTPNPENAAFCKNCGNKLK